MSEKVKGQKSPIMSVKEFVVHMLEVNKAHGTMADLAKRIGRSYQSTYTKLRSIQKKYPEIKLPKLANGKGQGKKSISQNFNQSSNNTKPQIKAKPSKSEPYKTNNPLKKRVFSWIFLLLNLSQMYFISL